MLVMPLRLPKDPFDTSVAIESPIARACVGDSCVGDGGVGATWTCVGATWTCVGVTGATHEEHAVDQDGPSTQPDHQYLLWLHADRGPDQLGNFFVDDQGLRGLVGGLRLLLGIGGQKIQNGLLDVSVQWDLHRHKRP